MKPAAFDYFAPRNLDEAVALLAKHGEDGRVLAGGQSLVPTMAFRMARPAVLVDINRIEGLGHLSAQEGQLRIGALARHAHFESAVTPGPLGALLARVVRHIAHPPIRMRGTFCGSLAHADPASEWCATTLALGGTLVLRSAGADTREVAARDWFQGVFTTAIRPGEMLVEVRLPVLGPEWSCGFAEFSRRAGDFALAMAVCALRLDRGLIREASIALGGLGGRPVLALEAAATLLGQVPSAEAASAAAEAAAAHCDPHSDVHAPAEYRRDLVRAMARRALAQAGVA
ncbi:FAD binding domain-containing protein [Sabulicella rubraurantiaca]|uniref:FAD binding domain-containing protein n=1 Tax=Sabulicella rubraurantiaca TaxID=2811429 RepID=UPI001A97CB35|nr:FAD binding domain-containing protein [Sabulicella rubraurantiaca]